MTNDRTSVQNEDEEIVPLDSQLAHDVAHYVQQYFPGSSVKDIQSEYHRGVFIGDFSIDLAVQLDHPTVQQVGLIFLREDVPGRPPTWKDLVALSGIRLFLKSITLRDVRGGQDRSATYFLPGMFQEQLEQWYKTHDDEMLYHSAQTSDLFIIATEGMEREIIEKMVSKIPEVVLDLAPRRTIEVSEREYRAILAQRTIQEAQPADASPEWLDILTPSVEVVTGKMLLELASFIEAGHTVYAHTGKLGTISFRRKSPGHYEYHFEFCHDERTHYSEEQDNHTIETFLASLRWDESGLDEIDREMQELLTQAKWSTVDEYCVTF